MIAKQKIIENIKKGEKKKNTPDDIACELFDLIQQLIVLRKQKGLSQVELSGLVNLGKSAIGKIETGIIVPQLNTLLRILSALDVEITFKEKNNER